MHTQHTQHTAGHTYTDAARILAALSAVAPLTELDAARVLAGAPREQAPRPVAALQRLAV
jgi:hypothetical protein